MKLEIIYGEKTRKKHRSVKTKQNSQWVKMEIKQEIKNYLETNEIENITLKCTG